MITGVPITIILNKASAWPYGMFIHPWEPMLVYREPPNPGCPCGIVETYSTPGHTHPETDRRLVFRFSRVGVNLSDQSLISLDLQNIIDARQGFPSPVSDNL